MSHLVGWHQLAVASASDRRISPLKVAREVVDGIRNYAAEWGGEEWGVMLAARFAFDFIEPALQLLTYVCRRHSNPSARCFAAHALLQLLSCAGLRLALREACRRVLDETCEGK